MKLYSIVDKKAGYIIGTFPYESDEAARRSFMMLLACGDSIYSMFPGDFDLYHTCDVSYNNGALVVSGPGNEDLKANGFKVDEFVRMDLVQAGSDFDLRSLKLLRDDFENFTAEDGVKEEDENGEKVL